MGQSHLARQLGPGDAVVIGKTASCAAMAMTFAAHALPEASSW